LADLERLFVELRRLTTDTPDATGTAITAQRYEPNKSSVRLQGARS
jgi:hypothetical protein